MIKNYLFFIVLFIALIPAYSYDKWFHQLYDHDWYEVHFYIGPKETRGEYSTDDAFVLVRLNGSGRWTVKRWTKDIVLAFKYVLQNDHFEYCNYTIDDEPILIGDYRISFNCEDFPYKLRESPHILGIEKAYTFTL